MSATETTLHVILQAIIIDGFQRVRPEADIKSNAEAAARALRAGLAAFTAPAEPFAGGSVGATSVSIPVTVNYGGAKDCAGQKSASGGTRTSSAGHQNSMAQLAGVQLRDQDPDRDVLTSLISRVIAEAIARVGRTSNINELAVDAVKAFEAGLDALAVDGAPAK